MSEEEKQEVKLLLSLMNATAKIVESTYSVVPLSMVLGTGMFSLNDAEKNDRWLKEARIGDHTPETIEYGITSFTYRALKPFYPKKLDDTIMAMLDKETPFDKSIILRAKGYMWLASYPDLQGDFSLVSLFMCISVCLNGYASPPILYLLSLHRPDDPTLSIRAIPSGLQLIKNTGQQTWNKTLLHYGMSLMEIDNRRL